MQISEWVIVQWLVKLACSLYNYIDKEKGEIPETGRDSPTQRQGGTVSGWDCPALSLGSEAGAEVH